jgi:hypothetical protein
MIFFRLSDQARMSVATQSPIAFLAIPFIPFIPVPNPFSARVLLLIDGRDNALELRRQHCQANSHLDSNTGKIMPGPAAIHGKRANPSQSSRAPSRSNNREDRHGLSRQASDSKAQKKSAVGRTELRDAQRSFRLDAKNAAHGTRE